MAGVTLSGPNQISGSAACSIFNAHTRVRAVVFYDRLDEKKKKKANERERKSERETMGG